MPMLPDLTTRVRMDTSELDKGKKAAQSSSATMRKAFTVVGATMVAVGGIATKMSQDFIKSQRNLKQIIENMGGSWKNYKGDVEQAYKTQARFGNSATDVNKALTDLTIKLGSPKKALDNLQLAADIAAFKNISLAEAALLVAKVLSGNAKVLKSFGITTKDSGKAIDELRAKMRGMAESEAKTLTGRFEGIKTSLQNFAAQKLGFIGPITAGLGTLLTTVASFHTIFAGLDSGAGKAVVSFIRLKAAAIAASVASMTLRGALIATTVATGALAVIAAGFYLFKQASDSAKKAGQTFADTFIQKIGGINAQNLPKVSAEINRLNKETQKGAIATKSFGSFLAGGAFSGALDKAFNSVSKSANRSKELKDKVAELKLAAKGGPPAIDPMTGAIDRATTAFNFSKAAAERYKQSIDVAFGAGLNAEEASLRTKDALAALNESLRVNGTTWDTNTAKGRANTQARIEVDRAIDGEVGALIQASKNGQLTNKQYSTMTGRLNQLKKDHPEVTKKVDAHLRALAKVKPKRADIKSDTRSAQTNVKNLKDRLDKVKSKSILVKAATSGISGLNRIKNAIGDIASKVASVGGRVKDWFFQSRGPRGHTGGVMTVGGAFKRYHSGGLTRDERPAILQVGEGVLQRSAMRKLGTANFHALNRGLIPASDGARSGGSTVTKSQTINIYPQVATFDERELALTQKKLEYLYA